ncbi:MAG: hypothetical protein ABSE58_07205 [Candidatus Limnocylindrales bacterium]|jgi:hypothetical protein
MVRHWIRCQVKFGEWKAFRAALKVHNDDAARVGLPEYRVWSQWAGPFGEAFLEAEYASVEELRTRINAAQKDDQYEAKLEALFSHTVPGTNTDWTLESEDLG